MDPRPRLIDVFVTHRHQLKRAAQDVLVQPESAEDLVQDACLKALAMPPEGLQEPVSYAFRMVRNMAIDRYRRGGLELRLFTGEDEAAGEPDTVGSPEAIVLERQQIGLLQRVLSAMPERTRRIFEMHGVEGCTQREIAARFGISPTMVHFVLRDVVRHCRAALHPGPTPDAARPT